METDLKLCVKDTWQCGDVRHVGDHVLELSQDPWLDPTGEGVEGSHLLGEMMLTLNKHEVNLYSKVVLDMDQQQKTLIMFRQSNITFSKCVVINLKGN